MASPCGVVFSATSSVFIKNLSPLASETHVREAFASCGEIAAVNFKQYPGSVQRYCEIVFKSSSGVTSAIALNNTPLLGVGMVISVIEPAAQPGATALDPSLIVAAAAVSPHFGIPQANFAASNFASHTTAASLVAASRTAGGQAGGLFASQNPGVIAALLSRQQTQQAQQAQYAAVGNSLRAALPDAGPGVTLMAGAGLVTGPEAYQRHLLAQSEAEHVQLARTVKIGNIPDEWEMEDVRAWMAGEGELDRVLICDYRIWADLNCESKSALVEFTCPEPVDSLVSLGRSSHVKAANGLALSFEPAKATAQPRFPTNVSFAARTPQVLPVAYQQMGKLRMEEKLARVRKMRDELSKKLLGSGTAAKDVSASTSEAVSSVTSPADATRQGAPSPTNRSRNSSPAGGASRSISREASPSDGGKPTRSTVRRRESVSDSESDEGRRVRHTRTRDVSQDRDAYRRDGRRRGNGWQRERQNRRASPNEYDTRQRYSRSGYRDRRDHHDGRRPWWGNGGGYPPREEHNGANMYSKSRSGGNYYRQYGQRAPRYDDYDDGHGSRGERYEGSRHWRRDSYERRREVRSSREAVEENAASFPRAAGGDEKIPRSERTVKASSAARTRGANHRDTADRSASRDRGDVLTTAGARGDGDDDQGRSPSELSDKSSSSSGEARRRLTRRRGSRGGSGAPPPNRIEEDDGDERMAVTDEEPPSKSRSRRRSSSSMVGRTEAIAPSGDVKRRRRSDENLRSGSSDKDDGERVNARQAADRSKMDKRAELRERYYRSTAAAANLAAEQEEEKNEQKKSGSGGGGSVEEDGDCDASSRRAEKRKIVARPHRRRTHMDCDDDDDEEVVVERRQVLK